MVVALGMVVGVVVVGVVARRSIWRGWLGDVCKVSKGCFVSDDELGGERCYLAEPLLDRRKAHSSLDSL